MMPGERGPTEKVSASGQAVHGFRRTQGGGGEQENIRLSDISLS